MNQVSLNLLAIGIFAITFLSLLSPILRIPPAIPAGTVLVVLCLFTVDTLSWKGQGATLLLDWFASRSPEHRQRVLRHEAGHFLVAHLLDIPIAGYTLNAWESFQQSGAATIGVQFEDEALNAELDRGELSAQQLDRYCTLWMAGIAAEELHYQNSEGGGDDRQKFRGVLLQLQRTPQEILQKERLHLLRAKNAIELNQEAYEALVAAMEQRQSVAECKEAIASVRSR